MHRYNTRFQLRQAAKKSALEPVKVPTQVPTQVPKKDHPYFEDITFIQKHLTIHGTLTEIRSRIKNAIQIFSYLAIHPGLIHENARFREVVRIKTAELRSQIAPSKENAINTFIGWDYHNHTEEMIQRLEEARSVLADCKQLEEEFKKVETHLQ
jgi:hypothetical protein